MTEQIYNVGLTEEQWTRLLNCAALAPFGQVHQLMGEVTNQIMRQKQAMPNPPQEPPPPPSLETKTRRTHPTKQ